MQVKLISYSQLVKNQDEQHNQEMNSDYLNNLVAYFARVSNPSNQNNDKTAGKLVKYLIDQKHFSPFEMVSVCLEIHTTRDIARQILRHRSFSFQEFSQRYAIADLGFELRETRLQDTKNRQNSIDTTDIELNKEWQQRQSEVADCSNKAYHWALDNGIAKEQARAVLPEGLTKTRMYVNGTLRSWIHYIQIRSDPSTQKEHREIALECAEAIRPIFSLI